MKLCNACGELIYIDITGSYKCICGNKFKQMKIYCEQCNLKQEEKRNKNGDLVCKECRCSGFIVKIKNS